MGKRSNHQNIFLPLLEDPSLWIASGNGLKVLRKSVSFSQYVKRPDVLATCPNQKAPPKAPPIVSIQDYAHQQTVTPEGYHLATIRLGKGRFNLIQATSEQAIRELFLFDPPRDSPNSNTVENYVPNMSITDIYTFTLLGTLTEGNAVQFALASGLMGYALNLQDPIPRIAPASTASSFTFPVCPHPTFEETGHSSWHHSGQVDIDSMFFARRNSELYLVICEAKQGRSNHDSLSTLKLLYPMLSVSIGIRNQEKHARGLPEFVEGIIPLYLRSWTEKDGTPIFQFSECEYSHRETVPPTPPALSDLRIKTTKTYRVPIHSLMQTSHS